MSEAEGAGSGGGKVAAAPAQANAADPKVVKQKQIMRAPQGCAKKTTSPLPDPTADRMFELKQAGYNYEPRNGRPHVVATGAGNKNYDNLQVDGQLVPKDIKGICRNEVCDEGYGRGLPSTGGDNDPFNHARPTKHGQLGRDMSAANPERIISTLKIDPNNQMRISKVFKEPAEGESDKRAGLHPNFSRPLVNKVPNRMEDHLGVGKELPEHNQPRILKVVPTAQKTTLHCGAQEPAPVINPPKKNTGPLCSSLGNVNGGLVPVRNHKLKLADAADNTPEQPPQTWDPVHKPKSALFSRTPAPFASGTAFGGGLKHTPGKKIEKRGIGEAPYAVGEAPMPDNAAEMMAKVPKCPFGKNSGEQASEDSLLAEQRKHRINKAIKPPDVCPFPRDDSVKDARPDDLDAVHARMRIKKDKSNTARPAPFAIGASTDVSDSKYDAASTGRVLKPRRQVQPAPFAVGGIMLGNHTHRPANAPPSTPAPATPAAAPAKAEAAPPPPQAEVAGA
eukprot:GHVN01015074.1.p1 GENE.GHVN01015074.1~~GHVN01015074.1.p1  ORF type:complete len:506 (-),score=48.54 GHVN01015074.1:174-1691(-)